MLQRSRVEDDQRILASKGRCNKCHLSADPNVGYVCVKGRGAVQPDILIVGEAPGYDESRAGEAFVGPAAKHGIKIIESLGIDLDTVRFSNTTRCFPHDKQMKPRTPNYEKETVHCIDYLYEEIDMTRPKVIIALGAYPTKVLLDKTGITKLAGTVHSITVKGKPYPVVPCPHFSADLRSGGRYTEAITRALQTAKAVVSEEEVPVASYVLNTTQEAVSFLKNLLKRHEEGKLPCIAYDMEYDVLVNQEGLTRGEASRKSNISLYDPERKIVAVSFATNSKEGYCIPLFVNESQVNFEAVLPYLQKVVTTIPVIAHNWLKAEGAWTTEKFGVKPNLFFDTMLASYCLYMKTRSHGLKVLASQLLQWPDWSQKLDVYLKSLPSEERSYKNVPLDILGKYSAITNFLHQPSRTRG
jgi:uracil-DNA glycosylase family 4